MQGGRQAAAGTDTTTPLRWAAPVKIDPYPTTYDALESVSCPSARFCMAADNADHAFTYNGSAWSPPIEIDPRNTSPTGDALSCPSANFCMAVETVGGNALIWNGAAWSAPVHVDPHSHNAFGPVSCASPSFCAAADNYEAAFTYHGSSWSGPVDLPGLQGGGDISCRSPAFCMLAGGPESVIWNGSGWSPPAPVPPVNGGFGLWIISCPSVSLCVGVEGQDAMTWRPASWSAPVPVDSATGRFSSITCPSVTFCVAVDETGHAFTWNGTSWSGPVTVDPQAADSGLDAAGDPFISLDAIACPSATFCVAVDSAGHAIIASRGRR